MAIKKLFLIIALVCVSTLVFANEFFVQSSLYPSNEETFASQLGIVNSAYSIPQNAVLLATSSKNYPITPGDGFVLSYYDGKTPITLHLVADNNCDVSIPSMGTIEGYGLNLSQLKTKVEAMVSTYYTYSSPQLTLERCGVYSVWVTGEATYAQDVYCWGLTRLSDLASYAGDYASTRKVKVTNSDGVVNTYDLYGALLEGSEKDNPYLGPNYTIEFLPSEKEVILAGCVKKTGVFQLLEKDNLYDVITNYGKGYLANAITTYVTVANYENDNYVVKTIEAQDFGTYIPKNGDLITVNQVSQDLPYVTIVGAVNTPNSLNGQANRIMYSFFPGEKSLSMLYNIREMLLGNSDFENAYITRTTGKVLVSDDVELMEGDVIVIPFTQQYVTVNGAVNKPGNYPYVPDKGPDYYINLAGGFSSSAKDNGKIEVFDKNGNKIKDTKLAVGAESIITAEEDTFKTDLALTVSVVGLVSTSVTILATVLNIILNARNL
ncbi:MAG: SLBB domain-containing protein [Sphaerochaetaceae bacterium]|nr:SLBB domain-containing protein [Sphaerochaetaceae bacterium]